MDSNQKTLAVYQNNFDAYVTGTAQESSGVQKEWIQRLLSPLEKDASILEIGSAFGRDAILIEELGFTNVTVSDAVDAAIDALRSRGFERVKKFNVLTDELEGRYELIFAAAVLLHFTEDECAHALRNLRQNLSQDGRFAFSVKQGTGEEWSEHKMDGPRFFSLLGARSVT